MPCDAEPLDAKWRGGRGPRGLGWAVVWSSVKRRQLDTATLPGFFPDFQLAREPVGQETPAGRGDHRGNCSSPSISMLRKRPERMHKARHLHAELLEQGPTRFRRLCESTRNSRLLYGPARPPRPGDAGSSYPFRWPRRPAQDLGGQPTTHTEVSSGSSRRWPSTMERTSSLNGILGRHPQMDRIFELSPTYGAFCGDPAPPSWTT